MEAAKRFMPQEREKEKERERKREKGRQKSIWQEKKYDVKDQKKCFEEEIVDAPFESNINAVVERHLMRNYTCSCCCQCNE